VRKNRSGGDSTVGAWKRECEAEVEKERKRRRETEIIDPLGIFFDIFVRYKI
jgi:hypothetical protein